MNQQDSDSDSTGDVCDNCPTEYNPDQSDSDGDGFGDLCDTCALDSLNDSDGDGICQDLDNCPTIANPDQADSDSDSVGDVCDNCLGLSNPGQADSDGDNMGDVCDPCPLDTTNDDDSDGVCGGVDNCSAAPNANQFDTDGDGSGDACDNCPTGYNPAQANADADNLGDVCDSCPLDPSNDFDNDGICGDVDNCPFISNPDQADVDQNGLGDVCENAVFIESKDVVPGQTDVQVGVYLSNNVNMQAVVVPFEVRSVTSGAFIANKFDFTFDGRFQPSSRVAANDFSDVLPKVPLQWSDIVEIIRSTKEGSGMATQGRPTPQPNNSCSGPVSSSFQVLGPLDFISPDAVLLIVTRNLPKGADLTPSITITFDVSNGYGTFVIDTCCATPANHIGFVDATPSLITPSFTKGIITIGCPGCCIADPTCDGIRSDILDAVATIGVAFRGNLPTQGPGCPAEQTDVDCSGSTDVLDAVKVIDVAFRGYAVTSRYCAPCED